MEDLVFPKPDGSVAIPLDLEFPTPGSNATCPCIIVDENRNEPLDWRCARGFQAPAQHSTLDWTGFAELPVSACAQFGEYGMLDVAARVKAMGVSTAVLLDLRQEAHGYLRIGGSPHTFTEAAPEEVVWRDDTLLPVSWFTSDGNWAQVGMTDKEAARWESSLLGVLRRQRHVTLAWPNHSERPAATFPLIEAMGEKDLATRHGFHYERLFITDHCAPRVEVVDKFVGLVKSLRRKTPSFHIHVHCHGGNGRCTTIIVFLDMLYNATRVSLETIVARNLVLYDFDLFKVPKKEFKRRFARDRAVLVGLFYEYCRAVDPLAHDDHVQTFEAWLQARPGALAAK